MKPTHYRISPDALRRFIRDLYTASDLPAADAELAAEIAVLQEMRGVRTHGLRRVLPTLERLSRGQINPRPQRVVLREQGSMAVLDGDYGVGVLGCMDAMERAIAKARQTGIGIAIVIHNNHFQSAAPYCLRAAAQDMIGIAFSNTQASMGYPGARGRVIGNSPLGFAVPRSGEFPIVFDSALTTSGGKLAQWMREGTQIPLELFGLDAAGQPTRDPRAVLEDGTPMPVGGHKGAGLAILVELLTGVLGGGAFLNGIVPEERRGSKQESDSQCCLAIDVAHFMAVTAFRERVARFIADLKSNARAPGTEEILLPGERAHRMMGQCQREGIPLEDDVADQLRDWAHRLDVRHMI